MSTIRVFHGSDHVIKEPAYDECYLDSMIQKTRYLFKLLARNKVDVFEGIKDYMTGMYRQNMDRGNPLYLNKTPKQILGSLGITVDLQADISDDYDEFILEWMADIYTFMQWKYDIASKEIVESVTPADLYGKYNPLHEASVAHGAEKLVEMYFND